MIISLPYCDICGWAIKGEYYSIRKESTDSVFLSTNSRLAVCSKCYTKIRKDIQLNQKDSKKD